MGAHRDIGTIRMATFDDAPALASMHVASWRETYAGIVPAAMLASLSVQKRQAMWEKVMRLQSSLGATVVYLLELDGKIIGFGSCGAQRDEKLKDRGYDGEISAIYVLRTFQRLGAGTRLLFTMALDLAGRGYGAASLWVLRDNPTARRFYERFGARVIAERDDVREDSVLIEVAYGWADLTQVNQFARPDC
jgi:ribosomal protein S18 acetylase RimI-like enzyme